MKLKHPEIPIPENMKSLPMTDRGYLKPWFVKADDFRVVDNKKAEIANAKKACWICGKPFTEPRYALVCSPISAMTRIFREPPSHIECAEYAMKVCPFILYPNSKRRTANLEEEATLDYINRNLKVKQAEENPGEYYLLIVDDFYKNPEDLTIRCNEQNVLQRQHWLAGQKQKSHPIPIVEYSKAPEELRSQLTIDEFNALFGHRQESPIAEESTRFVEITFEEFGNRTWTEPEDFSFSKRDTVVPVGASELTTAIHYLPTAFIKENSDYRLVAVLGLQGKNSIVSEQGEWLSNFRPAIYTCYPFKHGKKADSGNVLCFDTSAATQQDPSSSNPVNRFFTDDGRPTEALKSTIKVVESIANDEIVAQKLTNQLVQSNLIREWEIELKNEGSNSTKIVRGLYCVDEEQLRVLNKDALASIRDTGALLLAYCQLLSMKHIRVLSMNTVEAS